jgi:hypothetical protein
VPICRRTAPARIGARHDDADTAATAYDKTGLGDGENRQTFCIAHDSRRNSALGYLLEAFDDRYRLVNVILQSGVRHGSSETHSQYHRKTKTSSNFHGSISPSFA